MTRRGFIGGLAAWGPVLERKLPAGFEYWLGAVEDGRELASTWRGITPLGSLAKPFVALAFGSEHRFRYPELVCRPGKCWLPSGHNRLGIEAAIAHSCNAYFTEIARVIDRAAIEQVARRYGLPVPDAAWPPEVLIGRFGLWQATVSATASAYCELMMRRGEPGVGTVVAGMRLCAARGTAAGARARIVAKTGTVPCTHPRAASGDGLVAALFPDEWPRRILLVRAHARPGAETARGCADFFRAADVGR